MKFKVGDKVKAECKHGRMDPSLCALDGMEGTIGGFEITNGVEGTLLYYVDFPGDYGTVKFPEHRLTLVSTAPTLGDKLEEAIKEARKELHDAFQKIDDAQKLRDAKQARLNRLIATKETLLTL